MPEFFGKVAAPILSAIAKELMFLISNNADLRKIMSLNAPQATYFTAGTATNAAPVNVAEAASGNGEVFYQMVMVLDPSAGAGNYRVDGGAAAAAIGGGHGFPAGGGQIVVTGMNNIRQFSMIAQGATTIPFTRTLFK